MSSTAVAVSDKFHGNVICCHLLQRISVGREFCLVIACRNLFESVQFVHGVLRVHLLYFLR